MLTKATNEVIELAEELLFPYGVLYVPDGTILVTEQARGTVTQIHLDGTAAVVATCHGSPAGMAVGPDGWLYVCNGGDSSWHEVNGMVVRGDAARTYRNGSIQRVNSKTGEVECLYDRIDGQFLSSPSDLVFDRSGGFWFTDTGKSRGRSRDRGGLYYAEPDGSEIREVVYPLDAPSGVGLSAGGDILYVAESSQGRVYQWALAREGEIAGYFGPQHRGSIVADPEGGPIFNSLAIDKSGRLNVATSRNGGVTSVNPADGTVSHTGVDDPLVSGLAFGDNERMTLLMTASGTGRLLATTWHSPGLSHS